MLCLLNVENISWMESASKMITGAASVRMSSSQAGRAVICLVSIGFTPNSV
jgi:hypothetical protein